VARVTAWSRRTSTTTASRWACALIDLDSGWSWRVEYQSQIGHGDGVDHGMTVNVQKQF
jgi:hypothetical protein